MTAERNARLNDPQSSHDAAERLPEFGPKHRETILAALRERGPMAPEQIADHTGLDYIEVVRRCSDLKRDGEAEVREERGHRNRTGRLADVIAACTKEAVQ